MENRLSEPLLRRESSKNIRISLTLRHFSPDTPFDASSMSSRVHDSDPERSWRILNVRAIEFRISCCRCSELWKCTDPFFASFREAVWMWSNLEVSWRRGTRCMYSGCPISEYPRYSNSFDRSVWNWALSDYLQESRDSLDVSVIPGNAHSHTCEEK